MKHFSIITRKTWLILALLLCISYSGFAQTVTISTANCTATANEFQFDVMLTNNGPSALQFNSAVIRFTHSAAILAGGTNTIVFSYVNGSDFPLSWPPNSSPVFSYTPATRLSGVSTGNTIYLNGPGCAAPNIASAETKKIGRFSVRNTAQNFVPGADIGLAWNTTTAFIGYVACAQTTTLFNTTNGNRVLAAPCTFAIPAACSSPTVNSSPTDQSVCFSGNATFTGSFTGGSPAPSLVWQVQTGGVGPFVDLTEAAPYSGTTTNTLTITTPNTSMSTNRYRLRANNTCGDVFTNSALLTVQALDYANLQFPASGSICPGGSLTAYGQVYEPGVTEAAGQGAGITAEIGINNANTNPNTWTTWQPATFNVQVGNNDEYMASFGSALAPGTYYYTFRYSLNGCGYQYGGYSAGGGSFWDGVTYVSGVLTVNPNANAGVVSGASPLCVLGTALYSSDGDAGGTWSSTNPLVATVDGAGNVTAILPGTTNITYTVNTGCNSPVSSFKTLTVGITANAGTVSGTSPLCIGSTATYTSDGTAGGAWSSTNTSVATVDVNTGLVTALSAGTTDITYTISGVCLGVASSFKTLTVTAPITLAGTQGGPSICVIANVQPGGTVVADGACNIIAKIQPSGLVPVAGNVNTCVTVDNQVYTYQGTPYVQRRYDIVPENNAANATATLTLYYTQQEFDNFNASRGLYPALPGGPGDVVGIGNLLITQFHGTGTYPGNYNGGTVDLINPADNNIVWNAGATRWEITFNVNGFSGFYLHTSLNNTPLPVDLLSFSGRNNGNSNLLEWSTSSEQNSSYFELQRSIDGVNFVKAQTVQAAGNSSTVRNYNQSDNVAAINATVFYYRLKLVDISGSVKYSAIIRLNLNKKGFSVETSPNPFVNQLKVQIETAQNEKATLLLTDMSGRKIRQQESQLRKGSNVIQLTDFSNMPGGVYFLRITTDSIQETVRVVKQ